MSILHIIQKHNVARIQNRLVLNIHRVPLCILCCFDLEKLKVFFPENKQYWEKAYSQEQQVSTHCVYIVDTLISIPLNSLHNSVMISRL